MSFRGLQRPRAMWVAQHDQRRVEPDLWGIALRQLNRRGCAACDPEALAPSAGPPSADGVRDGLRAPAGATGRA
jgi:hypothetical protein